MKKVKFILLALVVIIVAAAVCGFVFFKDRIAFTARSKAEKGFSKALNTFDESEDLLKNAENYKYLKNIDSKAIEAEMSMNFDAKIKGLEDLIGDEDLADIIDSAIEELSNADITTKFALDKSNKQFLVSGNIEAENLIGEISGEAAITEDEIAFRSQEINEKFIKITDEDDDTEEIFEAVKQIFETDYNKFELTDEEIEHFKTTYGNVLDTVITDDKISSEKGEFAVNDEVKSCTVTKVTLDNDTVKELLKKYIETYQNDEKGKEIIKSKLELLNVEEDMDEFFDEFDDELDELRDEIDDIEGVTIEFTTYGTIIDVYGTELNITIDDETLNIVETFNKDNTNYVINFDDEEVATVDVKQSKDEVTVDAKITIEGMVVNVNITINEKLVNFKVDAENIATIELTVNIDKKKDTDKELVQDVKLDVLAKVPVSGIDVNFTMDVSENLKVVDSIDFPDTSDYVSPFDEDEWENYVADSEESASEYLEKLQDSELYKAISEYSSSSYDYSDLYDDDDFDYDLDDEDDEIDAEDLKSDIEDWYDSLDLDDDETKAEAIENDMISILDFSDYVDVVTYISWEEGEATDKGYLGIQLTDLDDNEYEFFIDLSKDKVYSEDDVPFDTESIDWNEY